MSNRDFDSPQRIVALFKEPMFDQYIKARRLNDDNHALLLWNSLAAKGYTEDEMRTALMTIRTSKGRA